jgi:hypothetical protein
MKYFFSILIAVLFLMFSCAGTQGTEDKLPEQEQSVEIAKEDQPEELSGASLEELSDIKIIDGEPQISMELPSDDIFPDGNKEELSKVEIVEDDIFELPEPSPDIAAAPVTEIAAEPPPVVPEEVPPIQIQTPQEQPPAQPPQIRPPAPPLPPPALLGPAEERAGGERESASMAYVFSPAPAVNVEPPAQEGEIVFSRTVRATAGQLIEIPFRGTGWVYLGELASRRGIVYNSRRLDSEGQSFIFTAEEAGTYALKFFKEDFIRGYILNDHIQVIVGEAPSAGVGWFNPPNDRGRVVAEPRWPSALEEARIHSGALSGSRPAAGAPPVFSPASSAAEQETVPPRGSVSEQSPASAQETIPAPADTSTPRIVPPPDAEPPVTAAGAESRENLPPEIILQRAKETFDSGNVAAAIALLDQYAGYFPSGTDELYWLYGQFYEANSPSRNVLLSLDYYRRLVNEYPQSNRYNDARRRIAYLERFYINIQ